MVPLPRSGRNRSHRSCRHTHSLPAQTSRRSAAYVPLRHGRRDRAVLHRLPSQQFSRQACAGSVVEQELYPEDRKQHPVWGGNKRSGKAWEANSAREERLTILNLSSAPRSALRGLSLPTDLLFDFPVGEQIFVTATRALPGPFYRVGATLVVHLHDEMAMKTHGWMAVNPFDFRGLCRSRHVQPPYDSY